MTAAELFEIRTVADEYDGRPYNEMRARLTCGCWGEWHFDASSYWDFPEDAHTCEIHGERQFDLTAQLMLNEEVAL